MMASRALKQLLEIRNLRAENLSLSLWKARADFKWAEEEEAEASAALDIAASQATGNAVADELRKDGVVSAAQLQHAVMRQSALRNHEADANTVLEKRKLARLAAQERAEQVAADFSRAQKAALRTEISTKTLEKLSQKSKSEDYF